LQFSHTRWTDANRILSRNMHMLVWASLLRERAVEALEGQRLRGAVVIFE
jgi:hypothetical protein